MYSAETVYKILGGQAILGKQIESLDGWRLLLERGLPFAALEAVARLIDLTRPEILSSLGITDRTLSRRKKEHRFHAVESDRLFRVARIAAQAIDVLGAEDKARRWLHKPNRALGGQTPLELLSTDIGVKQVEAVLTRIDYGIVS